VIPDLRTFTNRFELQKQRFCQRTALPCLLLAIVFVLRLKSTHGSFFRVSCRQSIYAAPIFSNFPHPAQSTSKTKKVRRKRSQKNLRQPDRPCRKSIFRRNVWKNDRGVPMVLVVTIWRTAASGQACSGEAQRAESAARRGVGLIKIS